MTSNALRTALEASLMDNNMAQDALEMNNLSATKLALKRQRTELTKAIELLEGGDNKPARNQSNERQ